MPPWPHYLWIGGAGFRNLLGPVPALGYQVPLNAAKGAA